MEEGLKKITEKTVDSGLRRPVTVLEKEEYNLLSLKKKDIKNIIGVREVYFGPT